MKAVGHKYIASEWRLFIDPNKTSLKGVILHNGNEFPSIAVAYAWHLKKCYEVMKMLLLKVNYHAHCWSICWDFRVIVILLGLQTWYTKYCCFLCYWDSRARDWVWVRVWSERDSEFDECLSSNERKAWISVKHVIRNFFGNHKSKHCKRYLNEMLTQFHGVLGGIQSNQGSNPCSPCHREAPSAPSAPLECLP